MRYDEPDILESEEDWGRRRANMRHEVSLPAFITDRLGTRIPCQIEDISATGMALNLGAVSPSGGREPLQQGTLAVLEFAPDPDNAPADRIGVDVRVMWRAPVSAGVRFMNAPPALRGALKLLAEAAVIARLEAAEQRRRGLSPAQRRVLQACRRVVQQQLPKLVWVARTELCNHLRLQTREGTTDEARAAAAEADLLDAKAMAITRTVELQVLQGFSAASDLEETQELTLMQLNATRSAKQAEEGGNLDMVSEDTSDSTARIAALAHTVEERHKSRVFELNVRLANVIGHPLDPATNTLLPGAICRILWQAITHHCGSARVCRALQRIMLDDVAPLVGDLYQTINETLDNEGVARIFDVRREPSQPPA